MAFRPSAVMFPPDEILWCLNTHVAHKLPSGGFAPHPRVNIAHTVVLRQGSLAAWFFTSIKDGSVKKKKRPNLMISNVIDHFCRHRPPEMADMPVAFFVAYESEKTHDPVRSIKYIMANELEVRCSQKMSSFVSIIMQYSQSCVFCRVSCALLMRLPLPRSQDFCSSGLILPPATITSCIAYGHPPQSRSHFATLFKHYISNQII